MLSAIGASATFSDQDQIQNTEAVDVCVSLNIIGGYPDGFYRPDGKVTRAQMCKMICLLCNGGREPALVWAVYSILIKKYTEQYDNFLVTRRVMLWAFITAVPLMLLTDGMPDLHPLFTQTNVLLSWLFLGVFGNAVCFAIWNIAFQRLGVVITNNYLYASPFVTLVVGYLLLDEQITVMSVIGAVLITVGVIVALKKPKEAV